MTASSTFKTVSLTGRPILRRRRMMDVICGRRRPIGSKS